MKWLRKTTVTGNRGAGRLADIPTGYCSYTFVGLYRYSDLLRVERRRAFARETIKGYTANGLGM
jgi:hypothetical protein